MLLLAVHTFCWVKFQSADTVVLLETESDGAVCNLSVTVTLFEWCNYCRYAAGMLPLVI
jgi:hypothetical protein